MQAVHMPAIGGGESGLRMGAVSSHEGDIRTVSPQLAARFARHYIGLAGVEAVRLRWRKTAAIQPW